MRTSAPRFCSTCGGLLEDRFVELEKVVRRVCVQCGTIAYHNPQVLVGTIVVAGDRVLLCRRAGLPAVGHWVLPGGFMECGETLEEAAARETFEETGVRLDPLDLRLHAVATLTHISEVYVSFLVTVSERVELTCGTECSEVGFFAEDAVPWAELAYPDIADYLRSFFRERRRGAHAIHFGRLDGEGFDGKAYRVAEVEEVSRRRTSGNAPASDSNDVGIQR